MFELGIQKNWIDALYARSSVRQYTGAPDKEQLDRLGETCRKLSWQGVKIRMFKGPGLKSQIKGTDVYAVIVAKRGTPMEVEGYMGEALVLEATSMGLGTCWLGAGFYPDIINRNVDLQTDEAVHCVISIGKANLPAFAPKRKELVKVCGMDEAQLTFYRRLLRNDPSGQTNIGVRNVARRLQLHFGGRCGFDVSSRPGDGLSITIRIPVQEEQP